MEKQMGHQSHYIHAGWLIDGSGTAIREKMLLKIKDGIVAGIEEYNPADCPNPSEITDLSYCCILPPLVDSHAHLCMSGTLDRKSREDQLKADYPQIRKHITQHLIHQLSHGVLAVRDGGDRLGSVLRYRQELEGEASVPVIMKTPGKAWYREGRYGSLIGRALKTGSSLWKSVEADHSGDYIKIVNSGLNSLTSFGLETKPQFSQEELAELVQRAEERGWKVMVHANGKEPVKAALAAGCFSIEHGFFMGNDAIELLADKQTFWVPTLYTMKACRESIDYGIKEANRDVVKRNLEQQLKQLYHARSCGARVAVGTDSGSIGVLHGESLAQELKLFLQAGYSLSEAIRCATYNGAKLLGITNEFGLIAKGRPASFLVVRGTPAQLPRKLMYLEAIYLRGKPSDHYRNLLLQARVHNL